MNVENEIKSLHELYEKEDYLNVILIIENNNELLFSLYPKEIVELHLNSLIFLGKLSECYKALNQYKTYPYISMEIEEFLNEMTDNIEILYKKINSINKEKLEDLIEDLNEIYNNESFTIDDKKKVEQILSKNINNQINLLCLAILFKNGIYLVDFKYNNKQYFEDLRRIHFPFSRDDIEYYKILEMLSINDKNVSIFEMEKHVLNDLRLYIFPSFFDVNEIKEIYDAINFYVHKCFNIKIADQIHMNSKYVQLLSEMYNDKN